MGYKADARSFLHAVHIHVDLSTRCMRGSVATDRSFFWARLALRGLSVSSHLPALMLPSP